MQKILRLLQPLLWEIAPEEVHEALSEEERGLPFIERRIETKSMVEAALLSHDWVALQREIEAQFSARVAPLQREGYRIYYFGSALIPLALCLGHQVGTWWPVRVFQQHHSTRSWRPAPEGHQAPVFQAVNWPRERDRSHGEAIVRISTSHRVEAKTTRALVPGALVEIDLGLEDPSEDAFASHEEMALIAEQWRRALDLIADQFTGVHTIHLFASVQSGVAFLLGAQLSKSKHPQVQTYHYNRLEQPTHRRAILLNGATRESPLPLTLEERELAAYDRAALNVFIAQLSAAPPSIWSDLVQANVALRGGLWQSLPTLQETPLSLTRVDESLCTVEDAFSFSHKQSQWQLDDRWLASLAKYLPAASERHRLLRLFILHEAVHRGPQGLTRTNSQRIGRFSGLVGEIDYLADVWAMLHERVLSADEERSEERLVFLSMIEAMLEGLWAFDDGGQLLREMQARRLNRYLLWSWQYLLLEREPPQVSRARIIELLSLRPLIELAGPEIALRGERVYFLFHSLRDPEVAVYHRGRLYRHGSRNGFSIEAMLDALRERNSVLFRERLRGAFEQTVR